VQPWALITGASIGIGYELSRLFAADKFNLVLVARTKARLEEIARDFRSRHGISAHVIAQDLARPGAAAQVFDQVQGHALPVSVLVNNAGLGYQGEFAKGDLNHFNTVAQLNMAALMELTKLFLELMLDRGEGRILNVSSTAAFLPGPFMNVYYASKAFVHSFSNAIAEELAGSGVTVSTLYPGPTRTEFFSRAGMERPEMMTMDATAVAQAAYTGLMRGQRMIVPGLINKLSVLGARLVPTSLLVKISRRLNSSKLKIES
jgi:uncharacterized protein